MFVHTAGIDGKATWLGFATNIASVGCVYLALYTMWVFVCVELCTFYTMTGQLSKSSAGDNQTFFLIQREYLINIVLSHTRIVSQSHDCPGTYVFVSPNILIGAHSYVLHWSKFTHYFSLYLHTHILISPCSNMLFILLFVNIDQYSTAQPPPQDTICMQSTLPKLTQISMPTCTHSFHAHLTLLLLVYPNHHICPRCTAFVLLTTFPNPQAAYTDYATPTNTTNNPSIPV